MEENKKKKNIKKSIIIGLLVGLIIGGIGTVSYAMFTYSRNGLETNQLITGDIWMRYGETSALTLNGAMPSDTYDSSKKFEFTIEGANTTTDKDVWYEIIAKRGSVPDGKTESNRLQDKYIKFTLTKQIGNGTVETVVDGESWEGLTSGKKIYVDKIDKNTNSTTHKYTLYMWISNKVGIGTNTTYTINEWNNIFASIKIDVNGDFTEKVADEPYQTINAMNTFPAAIKDQKANIKEVYFNRMSESAMQTAYDNATIKADLTYNNEGKVLAWLETNTTDNTKYNLIVASDGKTYLTTGNELFSEFGMSKIEFNNIDTSRVTTLYGMFMRCSNLVNVNLGMFDTSNVTNMGAVFLSASSLETVVLDNWNLRSVQSGGGVFSGANLLETISCKNWIIPQDFTSIFFRSWGGGSSIKIIDVTGWDLSNTTNIFGLFGSGSGLENIIGLSTWDTSNITNMGDMFDGCSNLTAIDLSGQGGNNLTNISDIFKGCTNLAEINMSGFNFGLITSLAGADSNNKSPFYNATNIVNIDLSNSLVNNVTNFDKMFYGCSNLVYLNLSGMTANNITYMNQMFNNCSSLIELDLSSFSLPSTSGFYNLFNNCSSLTTIYVSNTFDLSSMNTGYMPIFTGCTSLIGGYTSNPTHYNSEHVYYDYAHIDGGPSNPGYFTDISLKPTT